MNSDEDYHSQSESSIGSRRSKRTTRSSTKSKLERKSETQQRRKFTANSDNPRAKKPKLSSTENRISPPVFSGAALTSAELQQLLKKFRTDGHFRNFNKSPEECSAAPLVVSRTTDGKVVTTKIECYKQKRFFMRELAATMNSPIIENNEQQHSNSIDSSAVIFTSKLPETPENPLKFDIYCSSNSKENIPEIPSNSSAFSFVAPAKSECPKICADRTNFALRAGSSSWNSSQLQSNTSLENKNTSITSGFYYTGNESRLQNGFNEIPENCSKINESNFDAYTNTENSFILPTLQNRQGNDDASFVNSLNLDFPVQDENCAESLFINWNSINPINFNTIAVAANSASTISNDFQTDKSMHFMQSRINANDMPNSYQCISDTFSMPQINNEITRDESYTSGYSSSSFVSSWNGAKVIPSYCLNKSGESSYNSIYNENSQNPGNIYNTTCVAAASGDESSDKKKEEFYLLDENYGNEALTKNSAQVFLQNNYGGPCIGNFPEVGNIGNDLTTTNGEHRTNESYADFRDNLNSFNPNAVENRNTTYYDEWITGEMFKDEGFIISKTQNNNESFTDLLSASVMNEEQALYPEKNCYQFNNDCC